MPCGSPKKRPRTLSIVQFILSDQQKYSEKSENIICLDPYILNSFIYLDPISINVSQCMTSLLKLEITVSFLAFIAISFRVTEED